MPARARLVHFGQCWCILPGDFGDNEFGALLVEFKHDLNAYLAARWSEPTPVGIGYAYEQATHARQAPQFLPTIG